MPFGRLTAHPRLSRCVWRKSAQATLALARLLRGEFHHFDYTLAIVLGEVDALPVLANAEAWLKSRRVLVQRENRRDALCTKIQEIDCGARLGIGIEEIEAGGGDPVVSPETDLRSLGYDEGFEPASAGSFPDAGSHDRRKHMRGRLAADRAAHLHAEARYLELRYIRKFVRLGRIQ